MKRPPAAASKIVTLTTSPTPKRMPVGGRRSVKVPASPLGSNCVSAETVAGVSLTKEYGMVEELSDLISSGLGPAVGIMAHPPAREAAPNRQTYNTTCGNRIPQP